MVVLTHRVGLDHRVWSPPRRPPPSGRGGRHRAGCKPVRKRFRASVEHLSEALSVFSAVRDGDGLIVDLRWEFANAAQSELTGGQLVGRTLLEVLPNHGPSGTLATYRNVVETGEPYVEPSLWFGQERGDGRRLAAPSMCERRRSVTVWWSSPGRSPSDASRIKHSPVSAASSNVRTPRSSCSTVSATCSRAVPLLTRPTRWSPNPVPGSSPRSPARSRSCMRPTT